MRITTVFVALAALTCESAARPQEPRPSGTPSPRLPSKPDEALRLEAAQLEKGSASEVLGALSSGSGRAKDRDLAEQAALAGRLDEVTRAILRASLLRGLGDNPRPADLDERLSEKGKLLRARIVAHAEAAALQGILKADQGVRIHGKLRRSPPLLAGRYALPRGDIGVPAPRSMAEMATALRSQAVAWGRQTGQASKIFLIMLLPQQAKAREPIGLSAEQVELVRRLNEVTLAIVQAWLLRGLDSDPPPADLAERLSEPGQRLKASIVAHAEAIALEGILTVDQAERLRSIFWSQRGIDALLDPELASRLRLSPSQRDELFGELHNRSLRIDEISIDSVHHMTRPGVRDQPELIDKIVQEQKAQFKATELPIWEVLTPSQTKMLVKLLGIGTKPPAPANSKTKKSSRPG